MSIEALELADWRRRIAELYAEVREASERDPRFAWDHWRATRERLFREHPQSPVPAAARAGFRAAHWPYDERLRFVVAVERVPPAADPAPEASASMPWSVGVARQQLALVGRVTLPLPGGARTLGLFRFDDYAGGLFLPFRDATNGVETYGAGRYLLDTAKGADLGSDGDRLVIDLNFAYHPSCAFDPRWACPLAPPESRLDVRIEAGERLDR